MRFSVENLFFRFADAAARRMPPRDDSLLQKTIWQTCTAIKEAAQRSKRPYVLPKRFRVSMSLTVQSSAVPVGEVVRAWLPVPRIAGPQKDFVLVSSFPALTQLADESSAIRSADLEQAMTPGGPCTFQIDYDYTLDHLV